jgi:ABC-type polysaccharide/polyol phosphate transport system ATPase subunit
VRSAVSLKGIGKKYRVSPGRSLRLKEVLSFGKVKRSHDFWALQDINLEVEPGTTLGILGRNGAGKSTLLKIISGVLQPTTGTAEVNGRLTAIFSLGSGFNPEFTGRENAMLNGLILGIDHHEMLERFDDIAAFADIGEFMDRPIKTYSSGMRSRLGFAVAVNVDPDILVLDEALSAGDAAFKKKALQRMYDLRDSGTTVLFVSHSMGMVKQFCTDAILLHKGHLVASGSPNEVADHYKELLEEAVQKDSQTDGTDRGLDDMLDSEEEEDLEGVGSRDGSARPGGGARVAGIRTVEVLDEKGEPASTVRSGSTVTVRVHARYAEAAEKSALGITVQSRKAGVAVFSTDTNREGTSLGPREASEEATVDFTFEVPLQPGTFTVDATVSVPQGEDSYLDRAKEAASSWSPEPVNPPLGGKKPERILARAGASSLSVAWSICPRGSRSTAPKASERGLERPLRGRSGSRRLPRPPSAGRRSWTWTWSRLSPPAPTPRSWSKTWSRPPKRRARFTPPRQPSAKPRSLASTSEASRARASTVA